LPPPAREGYNLRMEKPLMRQLWRASMVGINLVAATFVGFVIGYYLDKWLGTRPWLTLVFLLLGIITGFRDLFRMAREAGGSGKKGS
jgi:ATP synthase protein I